MVSKIFFLCVYTVEHEYRINNFDTEKTHVYLNSKSIPMILRYHYHYVIFPTLQHIVARRNVPTSIEAQPQVTYLSVCDKHLL